MKDPVLDNEGNSYEKEAILQWLLTHNTSPITRSLLRKEDLKVNRSLKDAIEEYLKTNATPNVASTITVDYEKFREEENPIAMELNTYRYNDEKYLKVSINPITGSKPLPMDIVVVIDVSGSMKTSATVQQEGAQVDVGFTILDITKHAIQTVLESMKPHDRISIITFSDTAKVINPLTFVTNVNKSNIKSCISNIDTEGCTNIWSGLNLGLQQFVEKTEEPRLSSMLFMTDGIPSTHLNPPRGILESLKKKVENMKKETINMPTIYTFGFGNALDTELLVNIAELGNGSFSYIPDAGFVGTVLIHTIANICTSCGTNSKLIIKNSIRKVIGYEVSESPENAEVHEIQTASINYGQSKDIIIKLDKDCDKFDVEFEYLSYSGKVVTLPASVASPKECDDKFKSAILRSEFVELLGKIIVLNNTSKSSKVICDDFILKYDNDFGTDIITDLKGQVNLAVSNREYYNSWGANYLYSLMFAHKQQRCNNFKDKSVANYGGKVFKEQRDIYDDIFTSMAPPVPSLKTNADNSSRFAYKKGVTGCSSSMSVQVCGSAGPPINFGGMFNNRNNGCFHPDNTVHMSDNSFKKCEEIVKGDIIKCNSKKSAVVLCVIKMKCENNMCDMVELKDGLKITPYHPVIYDNDWVFPNTIQYSKEVACEYMYNYILDHEHTIRINNMTCVTLGHGIEDNDVVKHPYYGTAKVIDDLICLKGYDEGMITFDTNCIIRDSLNNVVGFDDNKVI
jgi:Mg-chelatase subunit ChlD